MYGISVVYPLSSIRNTVNGLEILVGIAYNWYILAHSVIGAKIPLHQVNVVHVFPVYSITCQFVNIAPVVANVVETKETTVAHIATSAVAVCLSTIV